MTRKAARSKVADKSVREELAELTEAVRELREDEVTAEIRRLRGEVERLRAERPAHHCHGCSCMHIHWQPYTWHLPELRGDQRHDGDPSGDELLPDGRLHDHAHQ